MNVGQRRDSYRLNESDRNQADLLCSLCPMTAAAPISAVSNVHVTSADVAKIPSIAFHIPDVEGSAYIRLYSNTTQTELACFSAVLQNGASFSHPAAISSVLGGFTIVAILSSFAVAIYGNDYFQIRMHFGHSLPVLVVFEVLQSVFFSGALNLAWPSICVAWWSNFAWSAGMIDSSAIVFSVNSFVGISGNSSHVGAAGSVVINNNGGLQQQQQQRLSTRFMNVLIDPLTRREVNNDNFSVSSTYDWAGHPVAPGLPVPGTWTGFAGELQEVGIPLGSAFLVGLIWLLIVFLVLITCIVAFRLGLEVLARIKSLDEGRMSLLRSHWLTYCNQVFDCSMLIATPMMFILSISQFATTSATGATAVASIIFVIFFTFSFGTSIIVCFRRLRGGHFEYRPDRIYIQHVRVLNLIPWVSITRQSTCSEEEKMTFERHQSSYIPTTHIQHINENENRPSVHNDPEYLERFGALIAHYRHSRWWFLTVWTVYQFVRACFIGGASAHPAIQVTGLFVLELLAVLITFYLRPFEGRRNLAIGIYLLGGSKVVTTGLSIAFLPSYNVSRLTATIIGLTIIVVQALLVIALLISILLSVASTYLSLMRNKPDFGSHHWQDIRLRYYHHLESSALNFKQPVSTSTERRETKGPQLDVNTTQQVVKINDLEVFPDIPIPGPSLSQNLADRRRARAAGVRNTYSNNGPPLRGTRPHRASLSRKDFLTNSMENIDENAEMSGDALTGRSKDPTRRASMKHMGNNVPRPMFLRPASSLSDIPKTPTTEEEESEKGLSISGTVPI